MPRLTNKSQRAYSLPARKGPRGAHRGTITVGAGQSIDVEEWYLDELEDEPGVAALLGKELEVSAAVAPVASAAPGPSKAAPKGTVKRPIDLISPELAARLQKLPDHPAAATLFAELRDEDLPSAAELTAFEAELNASLERAESELAEERKEAEDTSARIIEMHAPEAIAAIHDTANGLVLELTEKLETAGKNRKTVLDAVRARQEALEPKAGG